MELGDCMHVHCVLTYVRGGGICYMYTYKHGEGCGALNKIAQNVHEMLCFFLAHPLSVEVMPDFTLRHSGKEN